jgi:HK97 gp10 family phage protein
MRKAKMRMTLDMSDLHRNLAALEPAVRRKVLGGALKKAAEPIRAAAERNAPVLTGKLRDNIVVRLERQGRFAKMGVAGRSALARVGFTKAASHGTLQERGTKHHAAQPFLRPAFDAEKDNAVRIARQEIGAALERQAGKA